MIKILKYLSYTGLMILVLACKTNKAQIGYLNWDGANEYASSILNCFKEKAKQLGVEYIDKDAHNNEKEQYAQAIEMINQGVKILIIKPVNSVIAAGIVREAHTKGVIVIANDQLIKNCDLDYYLTFDSKKVGEYMAREALKKKPKGNYILLWGDKRDDNADLVKSGVLKVLQPMIDQGNINVIYQNYIEDWSLENAKHEVEMVMRLSTDVNVDAVVTSYDGLARGAISVLKDYNLLDNCFVSGQNAEIQSLKSILNNEQTVTIAKSPRTTGYALAEFAAKIIANNDKKHDLGINCTTNNGFREVPSILFDPVVIDKSNLEKVILSDGLIDKNTLYNN